MEISRSPKNVAAKLGLHPRPTIRPIQQPPQKQLRPSLRNLHLWPLRDQPRVSRLRVNSSLNAAVDVRHAMPRPYRGKRLPKIQLLKSKMTKHQLKPLPWPKKSTVKSPGTTPPFRPTHPSSFRLPKSLLHNRLRRSARVTESSSVRGSRLTSLRIQRAR